MAQIVPIIGHEIVTARMLSERPHPNEAHWVMTNKPQDNLCLWKEKLLTYAATLGRHYFTTGDMSQFIPQLRHDFPANKDVYSSVRLYLQKLHRENFLGRVTLVHGIVTSTPLAAPGHRARNQQVDNVREAEARRNNVAAELAQQRQAEEQEQRERDDQARLRRFVEQERERRYREASAHNETLVQEANARAAESIRLARVAAENERNVLERLRIARVHAEDAVAEAERNRVAMEGRRAAFRRPRDEPEEQEIIVVESDSESESESESYEPESESEIEQAPRRVIKPRVAERPLKRFHPAKACICCESERATHTTLPCGHTSTCADCTSKWSAHQISSGGDPTCATCREPIVNVVECEPKPPAFGVPDNVWDEYIRSFPPL